ncbi:carboxymuconolactone decarboxylase family protein [Meiothermus hypogaeus]|uniref:4-carboxymuconolactone decarboxylase n=2 Tax=Meiothermus hypogaeus TaxID=884155 RepID=A0A511R388_9DEIN|nr:carboxymuconolactone decarboxylase family protein [Meiothermus hypogaeus]RIH78149.1 4-carboxymuconolactone decarboxylase [Meiothermus hypogaeus]GEM84083.1 4-carboxymuconolactone decarboxylase [Meiothermus hypogaeus NBRC 106114]
MSVRKAIWGDNFEAIEQTLTEVDPDLYTYIRDFAYEEVLARSGLDLKTRELLAITSLIALGAPKEIATHLEGALRNGATEQEVRETIIQSALFVGFPNALGAMKTFHALLRKRHSAGK